MTTFVLASTNAGKLKELQRGLAYLNCDIIAYATEIEETGLSFVENALIKARAASVQTGHPAIADDSGLVIPALKGQPGIYSARFAGTPQNAKANIEKVLSLLRDTPRDQRVAWFHCALVVMQSPDDPTPLICQGQWQGHILEEPVGEKGFGYDPIFYDPILEKSAAELSLAKKNKWSHRGKAMRHLIRSLKNNLRPI